MRKIKILEQELAELKKQVEWEKIKDNKARIECTIDLYYREYKIIYIDKYNKKEKEIIIFEDCNMTNVLMHFDIVEETDTEIHISCKDIKNDTEPYILLVTKCRGEVFEITKGTLDKLNKFYKEVTEKEKQRKYKIEETNKK